MMESGGAEWMGLSEEDRGGEGIVIRLLQESDLPAIVAMDEKQSGRDRSEYYRERLASCAREPGINTSLVAEVDGNPVGFLMGKVFFGEFGIPTPRAVLDALGVRAGFRNHGVARALVTQYRKNLSALRVESIDTLVNWDRFDLLGFFKSLGFRPSRSVDMVWDAVSFPFGGGEREAWLRPATREDLFIVTQIDQESSMAPRTLYFSAKLGSALDFPDQHLFVVAELEGQVAGYLLGSFYRGEFGIDEARGVIDSFAVGLSFRHRGVASAMLAALLKTAESKGVRQIETLCRWNEWELLQFFEYAGFRPAPRINLELRIA